MSRVSFSGALPASASAPPPLSLGLPLAPSIAFNPSELIGAIQNPDGHPVPLTSLVRDLCCRVEALARDRNANGIMYYRSLGAAVALVRALVRLPIEMRGHVLTSLSILLHPALDGTIAHTYVNPIVSLPGLFSRSQPFVGPNVKRLIKAGKKWAEAIRLAIDGNAYYRACEAAVDALESEYHACTASEFAGRTLLAAADKALSFTETHYAAAVTKAWLLGISSSPQARDYLLSALNMHDGDPLLSLMYGIFFPRDVNGSIQALQRASQSEWFSDRTPELFYVLGTALYHHGDLASSLVAFKKYVAHAPADAEHMCHALYAIAEVTIATASHDGAETPEGFESALAEADDVLNRAKALEPQRNSIWSPLVTSHKNVALFLHSVFRGTTPEQITSAPSLDVRGEPVSESQWGALALPSPLRSGNALPASGAGQSGAYGSLIHHRGFVPPVQAITPFVPMSPLVLNPVSPHSTAHSAKTSAFPTA